MDGVVEAKPHRTPKLDGARRDPRRRGRPRGSGDEPRGPQGDPLGQKVDLDCTYTI